MMMIIIIIIITTMFMVLSWHSHCESSPGSFDKCRLSAGWPPTLRSNQPIWAVGLPKDGLLPFADTIAIYLQKSHTYAPVLAPHPTCPGRPPSESRFCQSRSCWLLHRGWCYVDWCRRCSASAAASVQTRCRQSSLLAAPAARRSLSGPTYDGLSSQHHCLDQPTNNNESNYYHY